MSVRFSCMRLVTIVAGSPRCAQPTLRLLSQAQLEMGSIEKARARLLYQSKKRGILENDIILGGFAEDNLSKMNQQQLDKYDKFINGSHMEWDIYYYLSGKKSPPKELAECTVFQQLKRYVEEKQRIKK